MCKWFSAARKLDDRLGRRLGTLGFLPLEIREKIWCAAIENYKDTFKRDYMKQSKAFWNGRETWLKERLDFQPPHGHYSRPPGTITRRDIFHIQSYSLTNRGWDYEGTMYLRYASPEAKVELENTFVFTNAFRFYCPRALDHFLDQLSEYQGSLLRSIAIRVFGCSDCDYHDDGSARPSMKSKCRAWLAIIERLPASLKFVTFELGRCGISLAVEYSCEERQPNQIQSTKIVVDLLELMTKKVQRQAPRAKINMTGLEERCEEDREILQTMLDEITPYSEGFKKWSEQTRKNGMGLGKEL